MNEGAGALDHRSGVVGPSGVGATAVVAPVDGLSPSTTYSAHLAGWDGTGVFAPGASSTFTTPAAPLAPSGGGGGGTTTTPGTNSTKTIVKLLVATFQTKLSGHAGKKVKLEYLSTAAGAASLDVMKGKKRVARITGKAKTGRNALTWNGKIGKKKATKGNYVLQLRVTGGDKQTATARVTLKLKR